MITSLVAAVGQGVVEDHEIDNDITSIKTQGTGVLAINSAQVYPNVLVITTDPGCRVNLAHFPNIQVFNSEIFSG